MLLSTMSFGAYELGAFETPPPPWGGGRPSLGECIYTSFSNHISMHGLY